MRDPLALARSVWRALCIAVLLVVAGGMALLVAVSPRPLPPEPLTAAIRRINDRSEARIDAALRDLHAQGRREGVWNDVDARTFLDAFYCLMDGLYSERFIYDQAEYRRRLASVWRVFWAGLTV